MHATTFSGFTIARASVYSAGAPPNTVMTDRERKSRPDRWTNDDSKQSVYFPEWMTKEIAEEAQRLLRSMSWVVQRAWRHARRAIKAIPESNEPGAQSVPTSEVGCGGGSAGPPRRSTPRRSA